VLGALIALAPFNLFPVCTEKVETAAGTLLPMACYWFGRYTLAIGILAIIVSALAYPVKDLTGKRVMFGLLTIIGIYTILSGTYIGGLCMDPTHPCRWRTLPAVTWLGAILTFIGALATLLQRRGE